MGFEFYFYIILVNQEGRFVVRILYYFKLEQRKLLVNKDEMIVVFYLIERS